MSSATPGPSRPAPQPTLPPARARVAALLGELGEGVPLAELATRIGGHPNATRAHLDALVEEGLAEAAPLPRTGPGRPALGWTLTDAGRRAVAGDPSAAAYAEILSVVVSHLAEVPGSEEIARTIGQEVVESSTGGGSDGNFTAALGVPTIDGLGCPGDGAHAETEHIQLPKVAPRTALITALLADL